MQLDHNYILLTFRSRTNYYSILYCFRYINNCSLIKERTRQTVIIKCLAIQTQASLWISVLSVVSFVKWCLHARTCIACMYDIDVYAIHVAILFTCVGYMFCVPILRTGITVCTVVQNCCKGDSGFNIYRSMPTDTLTTFPMFVNSSTFPVVHYGQLTCLCSLSSSLTLNSAV